MSEVRVTAVNTPGGYKTWLDIDTGGHALIADEPVELGGTGEGPESHSLLASSLATCIVMTLRMYADRKKWPLEDIRASVNLRTENPSAGFQTFFTVELQLDGPLIEEQRTRLLEIADKCPVHKILQHPIHIKTALIP